MARVLLVGDTEANFETASGVAALLQGAGSPFDITPHMIGRGGHSPHLAAAAYALRSDRAFDFVHAWGGAALAAALFAGFHRLLFSPAGPMNRRLLRWLRTAMTYRDVHAIFPAASQARWCIEHGLPGDRCSFIPPGVDLDPSTHEHNIALRHDLGLAKGAPVLLAVGESTRPARHDRAVWAASILRVLDHQTRLVLWGRGGSAQAAARLGQSLHQPELVCDAERRLGRRVEFEELISISDIAVVSAMGPTTALPVRMCMAAAKPIISTITPLLSELLSDQRTALMVPKASSRLLAQKILELREDPSLQRRLGEQAREASTRYSSTRFVEAFRTVYRQIASGKAVDPASPVRTIPSETAVSFPSSTRTGVLPLR